MISIRTLNTLSPMRHISSDPMSNCIYCAAPELPMVSEALLYLKRWCLMTKLLGLTCGHANVYKIPLSSAVRTGCQSVHIFASKNSLRTSSTPTTMLSKSHPKSPAQRGKVFHHHPLNKLVVTDLLSNTYIRSGYLNATIQDAMRSLLIMVYITVIKGSHTKRFIVKSADTF